MRFTALCRQVLEFEWSPKLEVKRVGSPSDIHSGSTPIWCRILKPKLPLFFARLYSFFKRLECPKGVNPKRVIEVKKNWLAD